MRTTFLILALFWIYGTVSAQNNSASNSVSKVTTTTVISTDEPKITSLTDPPKTVSSPSLIPIMEYESVYEAATLEDEVKTATERYDLSQSQQLVWMDAAKERRAVEEQAKIKLESKASNYDKGPVYQGLRSAQTLFYQTITGYLNPAQKQALEADRLIHQEKQRRLAKIAPPAPVVIDTVIPVDSTAIKEFEKKEFEKSKTKKTKKKG